ncbi:MAG: aldehyde ferredoxin oxidoreductase family protein [Methanocellales archaeon]|nr:aldehyde ferredoxin oxidoreductase family protein [Methanocellales archaeon]MDD3421436.1 aldehyde ferredoxin oxidoreductase family protein [Methanocellales archaeon]MDD4898340.1 aldehyde ferredoxin oxidoreductase family protein [Methanocellales archaeon]MDD5446647.1 aldehyde ferredoxin oxidoreductase family protein [Methanocellales archaeon]
MSGDYVRRFLNLDLSNDEIKEEIPDERVYRDFLGGTGLGVWHIYNRQMTGVDPLGPENIIGFVTGLLNGTKVPFSGRYTVVGKSPLTNTWGDANSGGFFGPELKQAGYDAIFIKGISKKPVYLWIKDGESEIRDASHLWGRDTTETLDIIKSEVGDEKVRVVSIGPSGEKLSLISCIINDNGRAAARSGFGAVMGSKKLKAIAVRGTERVPIDDPERLKDVSDRMLKSLRRSPFPITKLMMNLLKPIIPWILRRGLAYKPEVGYITESMSKYGTAMGMSSCSEMGDAPCKNWAGVGFRDFPMRTKSYKISDDHVVRYNKRKYACAACPVGCGAIVKIKGGPYALEEGHKPEYETLASFGSMTLNDNVESIIKANDICNRYGIDTISAGATIAFAMECYENNILTEEDTDGIELTWGNTEAIVRTLEKLAEHDGFGELLADGVKVAAERIGKGADKYAMHVHGQEIPMHDPRLNPSFATAYVTDPTPARHTKGGAGTLELGLSSNPLKDVKLPKVKRFQYKGKGEVHAALSKIHITLDSLGMCQFLGYFGSFPIIDAIEAVTGWDFSTEELMKVGERIQALRQLFNVREGIRPSDFKLPDRIKGIPPLPAGPSAGITIDLESMVEEFYKAMDWSLEDGKPSEERLKSLGLAEMLTGT